MAHGACSMRESRHWCRCGFLMRRQSDLQARLPFRGLSRGGRSRHLDVLLAARTLNLMTGPFLRAFDFLRARRAVKGKFGHADAILEPAMHVSVKQCCTHHTLKK